MKKPFNAANTLICLADTCEQHAVVTTMLSGSPTAIAVDVCASFTHPDRNIEADLALPNIISSMEHTQVTLIESKNTKIQSESITANSDRNMVFDNHSNDNLEMIHELTDLDKCRIRYNGKQNYQYDFERRSVSTRDTERCELHKKRDVYGNESIIRKRVEVGVYGSTRRTANLKFKCVRDVREWIEAIGRTMGVRVRAIAVIGLFLTMLATCAAAPAKSRPTRSSHHEKSPRSYLETFGYLKKGHPEVGNLLMGDTAQSYEDDFRIAVKTLQEFGGIPVTGEIDEATKELMKQKRCGRPDREDGEENGRRRKRFAIQGDKWKHTNLTWRNRFDVLLIQEYFKY